MTETASLQPSALFAPAAETQQTSARPVARPALRPAAPLAGLRWSLRLFGLVGTAKLVAAKLRGRSGTGDAYAQWRDGLCDRHLNIETAKPVEVADLGGDADIAAEAVEYRPTSAIDAALMLDRLPIDVARSHFLDLGCGKGRVVLLARRQPYQSVTGVEFSPDVAAAARRNLVTAKLPDRAYQVAIHEGDARDTVWPDGPLVVYLYPPFGRGIMQAVEASLAASLAASPRPCTIVYANPQHVDLFDSPRWDTLETGDDWWAVRTWRHEG